MFHLLSGSEFTTDEMTQLIAFSIELKKERKKNIFRNTLQHKQLALIFEKPSVRTRFSFMAAMHELGGNTIESISDSRKQENPADLMRVLQGYCQIVVVRTFAEIILEKMQSVATIPVINGLSDHYHPCQILADLMTLQENFQRLHGLNVSYIGDGNNILHSLLLMAPQLGIHLHYACPESRQPKMEILQKAHNKLNAGSIHAYQTPIEAVKNAEVVYTDVWNSMGCENKDEHMFKDFQVNEFLMKYAAPKAIFMHCMPMNRGKEVSMTLPDSSCSVIFQQSENRLHAQKALLLFLLTEHSL